MRYDALALLVIGDDKAFLNLSCLGFGLRSALCEVLTVVHDCLPPSGVPFSERSGNIGHRSHGWQRPGGACAIAAAIPVQLVCLAGLGFALPRD